MSNNRSFLKWAGGKYNCLSAILPNLLSGHRLIEPFAGSGVVFMNTDYNAYVLGETNKDLINLFIYLQNEGQDFITYCEQYFTAESNLKERYYEYRNQFNTIEDSIEKSALFLYLNRHGYNGLCRYNSKGGYNVPFGLHTNPYFPQKEMALFYQKSKQATFILNDFRKTFELAEKGDVIYCDPPYVPLLEHTKTFNYTSKIFSNEDQIELAELARETASKGIPVIISNHDTAFTRKQYQKANIKSFCVSRFINCHANLREPVKELIAVFK